MKPTTTQPNRTLQLDITKDVFNDISPELMEALPPSFHAADNAKYDAEFIVKYMWMMCAENASHEGIYQRRMDVADEKEKVITSAELINRIGGSSHAETLESCYKMLGVTTKKLKRLRMFKNPVITATDEHDIPIHIKEIDERYMARGRPKKGTSWMLRYTTVQVVGGMPGFTVAVHPTGQAYKRHDIVRHQLEQIKEAGITSRVHLLDKGFYNAQVINVMNDMKQPFIMPAVRNSKVIAAVQAYDERTAKAVQPYTINGEGGSADVNLVITKKKDADPGDPLMDRHLVFITNIAPSSAKSMLARIPEIYKKRWGIETGYRVIEDIRPRTSSRNMRLRTVWFYFSVIIYNVWMLANWFASGKTIGGSKYVRPPITGYRMLDMFKRICIEMITGRASSDLFFA